MEQDLSGREDIILVTIDCWRHDAPSGMPLFTDLTDSWESGTMITTSAATNGVLPSLLASQYYPAVYDQNDLVSEEVQSLPEVFAEVGYETASFVASNPFAGKWNGNFDTFWNDGIEVTEHGIAGGSRSQVDRLKDILLLRETAPAEEVLSRATDWWEEAASPRFLWVHLMEPHEPYKPGIALGREYGLLRAYCTLAGTDKFPERMVRNEYTRRQVKELYYQCVKRLDAALAEWIETVTESATVVVTADHGEEFDHGIFGHARLYDEVVKVPLYTNVDGFLPSAGVARQLDLAPSLLDLYDLPVPEQWEGSQWSATERPQPMITRSPKWGKAWLGLRTDRWKLIECYDLEDGFETTEAYRLADDPDERNQLSPYEAPSEVRNRLETFRSRRSIRAELSEREEIKFDESARSRLEDLGYIK